MVIYEVASIPVEQLEFSRKKIDKLTDEVEALWRKRTSMDKVEEDGFFFGEQVSLMMRIN